MFPQIPFAQIIPFDNITEEHLKAYIMRGLIQINMLLGAVSATPSRPHTSPPSGMIDRWAPAGPNDMRGPCPMMNTLANHNFLPHDGGGITRQVAIDGLGAGLNFSPELVNIMFEQAIGINPEPNATFFTLGMLNEHNALEHDASISRSDAYFGNNHIFNQTVFDSAKTFFTADMLTPAMIANAKLFRQIESRATNPTYRFTATVEQFSVGEMAAPAIAFGDLETGEVNRTLVEYFFENEKLPYELGWTRKSSPVGLSAILHVSELIRNATSLLTVDSQPAEGSSHGT